MTVGRRTMAGAVLAAVFVAAAATGVIVFACRGDSSTNPDAFVQPTEQAASSEIPFLTERPAAAYLTTQICSILDTDGGGAGIRGQDGGTTNVIDGRSYWTFGDTVLAGATLPNNVGVSTDDNPDDCIDINRKTDASGKAAALLPSRPDELSVWPAAGQVSVQPGVVHFLFSSVVSADPATGKYEFNGIGLGRFGASDLAATRVIEKLIDPGSFPGQSLSLSPATDILVADGYVYIYFAVDWNVRVGRVPAASIEDKGAYQYWDGTSWVENVANSVDILRTAGGQQAFNVTYNAYLRKWAAMYSSNTLTSVAMAYSDAPEGPFTDETVMIDCRQELLRSEPFRARPLVFSQIHNSYLCYHATQHREYDKNGGQTIYLTYGNLATYTLWLDRLVLAVPFAQWDDGAGRSLYVRQGQPTADATEAGVAFYVPTEPGAGLTAIHDWYDAAAAAHRYEQSPPGPAFVDRGIAFYAAASPGRGLEPVARWDLADGSRSVYSTFDLSGLGYTEGPIAFYAATLADQTSLNPDNGYVYWVRERGGHDFGCCDQRNNPTHQTQERRHDFTLSGDPSPNGYEAIVCSPVCGTSGKVIWSGPVKFSPDANGGKLTLTDRGPK